MVSTRLSKLPLAASCWKRLPLGFTGPFGTVGAFFDRSVIREGA
jgi:hypothetical protein